MKYFRVKFGLPGYRFFLRLVFPLGKRDGRIWDPILDAHFIGPHVYGRVIEIGWRARELPFLTFGSWSCSTGPRILDLESMVHVPDCMKGNR